MNRSSVTPRRSSTSALASARANGSFSNSSSGRPPCSRECLQEQLQRREQVALLEPPSTLLGEEAETVDVELSWSDLEDVAAGRRLEPPRPEELSQPRDLDLEAVRCGRRRVFAPQQVDEAVLADYVVRMEKQDRQQPALLRAADAHHVTCPRDLKRAEEPELEQFVTNVTPAQ